MRLHTIDIVIIIGYLVSVISLGWYLSRRAGKNLESYFLSGKSLPWYVIGISHGASGFDITGTMWFVLMFATYGVKAVFILWIWPMFAMIFRMMYLGSWIRRSNVLTGAEWMYTRFSRRSSGHLAHFSMVAYAVLGVISFLCYAFKGIGKFATVFFPWDLALPALGLTSPDVYAILVLGLTSAYLIVGGMYSVILTDLIQYVLLVISAISIAIIAMSEATPQMIADSTPQGWGSMLVGWWHSLDWSGLVEALHNRVITDAWSPFSLFILILLVKGILNSMAGPTPGYGMQHVLATRNPREAALENGWISLVAFIPRFLMISAIVVLGLVFFSSEMNAMGADVDGEQILPHVINRFLRPGLVGIVLAGLLAAFMSTFDSTVNAGTAYIANDIYKRYINPNASDRKYVIVSYICSISVVIIGIIFGLMTESIHSVTKWIVGALFGGFTAPNILKWHWWRFNGYGFFAGMVAGAVAAMAFPKFFPEVDILYGFFFIVAFSGIASVVVCLLTPPEDEETLDSFYIEVRPWGFWKPVYARLRSRLPELRENRDFVRDFTNCLVGIVWQTSLVTTPMYIVIRQLVPLSISLLVLVATTIYLKSNWYDKLGRGKMYTEEDTRPVAQETA